MKRQRFNAEQFAHFPRGTLGSDRRTQRYNRRNPRLLVTPDEQYFVPSYAIRRRVLLTPETEEFMKNLKSDLPRNYRIINPKNLALTIVEQRSLIKRFRHAQEHPEPEVIEGVAEKTAEQLKKSLKGVPRKLRVPTGRVDRFGEDGNKNVVGIIPAGWRGFTAHYAERGVDKEVLPLPVIIRETDISLGGLVTAFGGNETLERGIKLDGIARTPHISVARKEKGGPISQSEMQAISGIVEEVIPLELDLFDPVIHLKLNPGDPTVDINARSPIMLRHAHLL